MMVSDIGITASDSEAAAACRRAMLSYVQRRPDVVLHLNKAIERDPNCAVAHACLGLMLHGAKHMALQPMVLQSLKSARAGKAAVSERERLYIQALESAAGGRLFDAVSCYESILQQQPDDLFAHCLLQAELFWLGDMRRSLRNSTALVSSWHPSSPGYEDFLAMYAFDLEEGGYYAEAEKHGRHCVELREDNIWGTHAVAHVLYMQGRSTDGIEWLEGLQGNWSQLNQLQFHLWWHKCLFHLERREHDEILHTYDQWVRNRQHELVQVMPDLYIDLQNASSLLWRLELAGVDVGDRWKEMAALVSGRLDDHTSPFTSAHFAVIMAAVGDFDACDRLLQSMQDFLAADDHDLVPRYRDAGLPAAIAAVAHRRGDYRQVLDTLLPVRHDLWQMGGSHAQQDLFFQMLVDAAARCGERSRVVSLLSEIEQIGFVAPAQRVAYDLISNRSA